MSEEQAKPFIEQAGQSLQGGQFAQAVELLDQAIALQPENSEAFVLRGIALSQMSQPDGATEAFRRAIMLSPYNVKAYFNLSVHYYTIGEKAAAEEMAREAVRIDPKHAGAKDLLARIRSEQAPREAGAGGPLPGTGVGQAEPPGPASAPPGAGPQQPGPGAPLPQQGYYRPGYEQGTVHSMPFVENLGKRWDTIGWTLGGVGTALGIVSFIRSFSQIEQIFRDPEGFMKAGQGMAFMGTGIGDILLQLMVWLMILITFIWFIMEMSDRRGNWLWMLPLVLCCCCGFQAPVVLIYLWKGRD